MIARNFICPQNRTTDLLSYHAAYIKLGLMQHELRTGLVVYPEVHSSVMVFRDPDLTQTVL